MLLALLGCGSPSCEELAGEQRDSCLYARALETGSVEDAQAIQAETLRAAAVEGLIAAGGLDRQQAQQLCSTLSELHREGCRRTWERPHLWE